MMLEQLSSQSKINKTNPLILVSYNVQINQKSIICLYLRAKTIKYLEENIQGKLIYL